MDWCRVGVEAAGGLPILKKVPARTKVYPARLERFQGTHLEVLLHLRLSSMYHNYKSLAASAAFPQVDQAGDSIRPSLCECLNLLVR